MKKFNSIISFLLTLSIVCAMSSVCVAAIDPDNIQIDTTITNEVNFSGIVKAVLNTVAVVAAAVAVGMLAYIGIQYAMKGAGGKATAKETLLPYLIGAIIIGSASTLAGAIMDIGKGMGT